jgi:hypothetical protein
MPSNAIIVDEKRMALPAVMLEAGYTASNYLDDGEPHFARRVRTKAVRNFVLHETCGSTAEGCKNTLVRKGYGVQLILASDGHVSCHGDLVRDRMVHANQLNDVSFGIEVVNPYTALYAVGAWSRAERIPAQWWTWVPSEDEPDVRRLLDKRGWAQVPREYVVPMPKQMGALRLLVPWLCELTGVPFVFPTAELGPKRRKLVGWDAKPAAMPGSGVVAHRDFASHADGRYLLERIMAGR